MRHTGLLPFPGESALLDGAMDDLPCMLSGKVGVGAGMPGRSSRTGRKQGAQRRLGA